MRGSHIHILMIEFTPNVIRKSVDRNKEKERKEREKIQA